MANHSCILTVKASLTVLKKLACFSPWDHKESDTTGQLKNKLGPTGFLDGSVVKNAPANIRDMGSIPGSGRSPREGNGNPLQYSCEKSHGQRSLAGYSPWGHRESDIT